MHPESGLPTSSLSLELRWHGAASHEFTAAVSVPIPILHASIHIAGTKSQAAWQRLSGAPIDETLTQRHPT